MKRAFVREWHQSAAFYNVGLYGNVNQWNRTQRRIETSKIKINHITDTYQTIQYTKWTCYVLQTSRYDCATLCYVMFTDCKFNSFTISNCSNNDNTTAFDYIAHTYTQLNDRDLRFTRSQKRFLLTRTSRVESSRVAFWPYRVSALPHFTRRVIRRPRPAIYYSSMLTTSTETTTSSVQQ